MNQLKPFSLDVFADRSEYIEILDGVKSAGMHSGRVILQPGKDVGRHSTGNHEELIIILRGEGELEVDGAARTKIQAGMVAYNPPQIEHNVINTGKERLIYIYVVTPVHSQ